jgi:hypothetical protein
MSSIMVHACSECNKTYSSKSLSNHVSKFTKLAIEGERKMQMLEMNLGSKSDQSWEKEEKGKRKGGKGERGRGRGRDQTSSREKLLIKMER